MPVQREWIGFGTVEAMDTADVPARVSAIVREIPTAIEAGAAVSQGELIVQLDDSDFARQVEIATQNIADIDAQLERLAIEKKSWEERLALVVEGVALARAEYERVRDAEQRTVAKPREVDQARQALLNAISAEVQAKEEFDKLPARDASLRAQQHGQEASLRLAQQDLERCRVTAPLAGVIQSLDVEVGENLQVGQRVARVVNVDRLEVPLRLPSAARSAISPGDAVQIFSAGASGATWRAEVSRVLPEDDTSTRTFLAYVNLERTTGEDEQRLAPGTFVQGTVTSSRESMRWVVPRRALKDGRLLVISDDVVTSRSVDVDFHLHQRFPQLGVPDDQWVVLENELHPGDLILINAARRSPGGGPCHAGTGASDGRRRAARRRAARRPAGGGPVSLPRFGVTKPVPVNLLMVALLLGGSFSGLTLRRQFFPDIDPESASVTLPYPGATPEEIEETMAIKVEDALADLDEVDELRTTISEGGGGIVVRFREGISNVGEATDEVEREIDSLQDLPEEAEEIQVTQLESRLPVIMVSIFGNVDEEVLKRTVREVRDELKTLPGMGEVLISGVRDYEVRVDVRAKRCSSTVSACRRLPARSRAGWPTFPAARSAAISGTSTFERWVSRSAPRPSRRSWSRPIRPVSRSASATSPRCESPSSTSSSSHASTVCRRSISRCSSWERRTS